ncbi:MAG TPA: hypothetical protein VF648_10530 [Pyrinomonadaceae bacterium]|jgi:hypothetical protein
MSFPQKKNEITKEQEELRESLEALLQSAIETKNRVKRESKGFIQSWEKHNQEFGVELDKIKYLSENLSKGVTQMIEDNKMRIINENRYFFDTIDNEKTKKPQNLPEIFVFSFIIALATACVAISGFLIYENIIFPLQTSVIQSAALLTPFIIISVFFLGSGIFLLVRFYNSFKQYRILHEERVKLSKTLLSAENHLISILDIKKSIQLIKAESVNNEIATNENNILWKKYDSLLLDVYKERFKEVQ